jgi:hypothetical protein
MGWWIVSVASVFTSAFALVQPSAAAAAQPLPAWITKAIAERQHTKSSDVIEEASYEGKRVFEIILGDRFDTGDEHILLSDDGKQICKFGGFVGRVTSGSCAISKVTYVRTLYPEKR